METERKIYIVALPTNGNTNHCHLFFPGAATLLAVFPCRGFIFLAAIYF